MRVGDTFPVGSLAGTFTLTVVGTISDAMGTSSLAIHSRDGEKLHPPPANGILVSWAKAEKIAGGSLAPSCFAVKLRPKDTADASDSANRLGFSLPSGTAWIRTADLLSYSQSSITANFQKMQAYSATGLAMLVSFVIIFTSLGMGLDERVRQLAVLRTVALTRLQTAAGVVLEAIFLGVIGWVGGLASGWILLAILPAVSNSAGQMADARIGFWTISLTGVCALLGSLLAAAYPTWRATGIRPLDAMAPLGMTERRRIRAQLCSPPCPAPSQSYRSFLPGLSELTRIRLYAFLGCPAMALSFAAGAGGLFRLSPAASRRSRTVFRLGARLLLRSQLDANLWRASGTVIALSIGLGLYMRPHLERVNADSFIPGADAGHVCRHHAWGIQRSLPDVRRIDGIKSSACLPVAVEQVRLAADLTGRTSAKRNPPGQCRHSRP